MGFVKVARAADFGPGECRSLRVGIRRIAVFNIEGSYHAIEDACRHMKAPLSTGRLAGTTLTCSWHGWRYDVTTGQCLEKSWGAVRTWEVRVENGMVLVSDEERAAPEPDDDPDDVPMPVFRKPPAPRGPDPQDQ